MTARVERRPGTARDRRTVSALARAALAAFVVLLGGCPASPPPQQQAPAPEPPRIPDAPRDPAPATLPAPKLVVVAAGAARPETTAAVAFAEIASTAGQRERGLMGRDRLEPDHGMLFVYPRAVPRRFWMKGCTSGLDIAFVRPDGSIAKLATLPAGAGLTDDRVPFAESGVPVLWVLEMEPGWFARKLVAEGDRIDVSAAVAGVTAE